MNVIYMYALNIGWTHVPVVGVTSRLPALVAMQDDQLCIWLVVDTESTYHQTITYAVVGTGQRIPVGAIHRGSVTDRIFVWHLFELPGEDE